MIDDKIPNRSRKPEVGFEEDLDEDKPEIIDVLEELAIS